MSVENPLQLAAHGELARTLEQLTRALLDPAPGQVEQPRVVVVPEQGAAPPEPVVLRPRRSVDVLAELGFLDG